MPPIELDDSETTPILINRGDVESLLCTMLLEPTFKGRCRVRHLRTDGAAADRLEERARWQAKLLEAELETCAAAPSLALEVNELSDALSACTATEHVVWPRRAGPDAGRVAEALECAQHLVQAIALTSEVPPRTVLTPIIDLTAAQSLDLLLEQNAPLSASWPCSQGQTSPCGASNPCAEWVTAFQELGQEWPWGEFQTV